MFLPISYKPLLHCDTNGENYLSIATKFLRAVQSFFSGSLNQNTVLWQTVFEKSMKT